jgi:hypothetical protein
VKTYFKTSLWTGDKCFHGAFQWAKTIKSLILESYNHETGLSQVVSRGRYLSSSIKNSGDKWILPNFPHDFVLAIGLRQKGAVTAQLPTISICFTPSRIQ